MSAAWEKYWRKGDEHDELSTAEASLVRLFVGVCALYLYRQGLRTGGDIGLSI